jgi:hypothetical protein
MRARYVPLLFTLSFAGAEGAERSARADSPDVCVAATVEGQKLQRAGKLVEARDRYVTCARAECPEDIVSRCATWAQGVIDAIPSLVVIARDEAGTDIPAARVRVDGGPPAPRSARAIELNPGTHRITVERDGSAPVTVDVVLHDGEKNRAVNATFPGPKKPSALAERPVPAVTWVAAGVGVAALGAFTFFAIDGAHDRTASHCDTGCARSDKSRVDGKLFAADLSLGIGLVAAGVATWLYLTRPTVFRARLRDVADSVPVFVRW